MLTYRDNEISKRAPAQRMSPHDPSLKDALLTADFAGGGPDTVLLVGVIPHVVQLGTELTPEVQSAMPKIEDIVLQELATWGITPIRKPSTQQDIWWSR